MKLLFVNQTLGIGGAESYNADLLDWLNKNECQVTAFTTNVRFAQMLEKRSITTHTIPFVVDLIGDRKGFIKGVIIFPVAAIYYLCLLIVNRDVDIILMTGFIEKVFITPLASLLKIPVVWVEFASPYPVLDKFFKFPRLLYDGVRSLPQAFVVPSKHTQRQLSRSFTQLITLGINSSSFVNQVTKPKTACCVSRLESGKGQDLLILAWSKVIKHIPQARLIIVGEGDRYPFLFELIHQLQLESSVTLTGWVENAQEYISTCQVFVLPTVWQLEGFGMVAVEAMSLKKPVVAFATGPIPEIVDSKTGILVPSGDVDQLAAAIVSLLQNPQKCKSLGLMGFKKFLSNFQIKKSAQQFLRLFNDKIILSK